MLPIALASISMLVVSIAFFDRYLAARRELFAAQHRREMSRFRALLA